MYLLKVSVNKLNKRKAPVADFSDKTNIVGTVNKGYTFEGEKVTGFSASFGDWYKDKEGYYYWGEGITIVSAIQLAVTDIGAGNAKKFIFRKEGNKHFANTDGKDFYVGRETDYEGRFGLFNRKVADGPVYDPRNYPQHGFWSWFIYPTSVAESQGSFHCLNTYDRAVFTFTFMQFAAHVPNGDFVKYLRRLLQLPEAKAYFPFLELKNGRVWYINGDKSSQLETDGEGGTLKLMNYLNSNSKQVDDQELNSSARFVHWAQNSKAHQDLQVELAVEHFKVNMKSYAARFNLHGWPAHICHTVCDILHQGRGRYSLIQEILSHSPDKEKVYEKLVRVGKEHYTERVNTLLAEHKKLRDTAKFSMVYDTGAGDFVQQAMPAS